MGDQKSKMYTFAFLGIVLFAVEKVSCADYYYSVAGKLKCKGKDMVHDKKDLKPTMRLYYSDGASLTYPMRSWGGRHAHEQIYYPSNDYNFFVMYGKEDATGIHWKPYVKVEHASCANSGQLETSEGAVGTRKVWWFYVWPYCKHVGGTTYSCRDLDLELFDGENNKYGKVSQRGKKKKASKKGKEKNE